MPNENVFSRLLLDGADFTRYSVIDSEGQPTSVLSGLSRVNFFVGPNNSGKSTLLRQILRIDKLRFAPSDGFLEIARLATEFADGLNQVTGKHITEISGLVAGVGSFPSFDFVAEGDQPFQDVSKWVNFAATVKPSALSIGAVGLTSSHNFDAIAERLNQIGNAVKERLDLALARIPKTEKLLRLYIPALRGLRPFGEIGDCYAHRTQSDYFNTTPIPTIFTGLTLRADIEELKMGDFAARKSVEQFQEFLGKEFFNGQDVALLSRKGKDVLYVKIGQEVELPIYELGDGIQTIIITTFPLFKNAHQAALVCIEEPELYLHPGFQRVLLKTLTSFPRNIYFIATHSNHLLDLTLDFEGVSIFTFHKQLEQSDQPERKAKFTVERVSSHDQRALQLLGTRNSSVFLSNCTVWVEGITDRRYLSHFLNLYQKTLRNEGDKKGAEAFIAEEDLHYSFVEYAGSNITHWSFLDDIDDAIEVDRLCSRLFLITDRDEAANPAKQDRHKKLAAKLNGRYYCLECREIENLLPPEILSSVVKQYEGEKADLNLVSYDDYKGEPLGAFIEEKLLKTKQRKGSYKIGSGTLADKLVFCERAITTISHFDELSEEAQKLTRRIYEFIKQENQR